VFGTTMASSTAGTASGDRRSRPRSSSTISRT
jgi:hypothetical protein